MSNQTAQPRAFRALISFRRALLVIVAAIAVTYVPGASPHGYAQAGPPPYVESLLAGATQAGVVGGPGGVLYGVTYEGGANNFGTIFVASSDLSQVTPLWDFNDADGRTPYSELTLGASEIYGTTFLGGPGGAGTVFKLSGNTLTTLQAFDFGGPAKPSGPLLLIGDFLYGSTSRYPGGSAVFRVRTDGTDFEILHTFTGPDGYAPGALTLGPGGFLYGTAAFGGDLACDLPNWQFGCGTAFRLNPDGSGFEIVHTFVKDAALGPASVYPQRKLVAGTDGRLYGTTYRGVFSLAPDPAAPDLQIVHTNAPFNSIFTPPIEGLDGRIYFTEYFGGADGAGTVSSVRKDGANPIVHHEFSYANTGGNGPYGILYQDSAGTIFGTTENNGGATWQRGMVFAIRGGNLAPIASAAAPATAVAGANCLASVALDGSGSSDPNGDALSYVWKEGAAQIATGVKPTVQLAPGSHAITLTVTDPSGARDTETVTVIVTGDTTLTYQTPALLQAGIDNTVTARLVGANGPIAGAAVTFTAGGIAYPAITDAGGIATATIPVSAAAVAVVIQVDYAGGACGGATTTMTVPVNRWPVAIGSASSPNIAGPACTASVTLDASGSSDPDLDPLTYSWKEGATVLSTVKTPAVSLPGGLHQIVLTVSDGRGGTGTASISAEVLGEVSTLDYTGPAQMPSGVSTAVSALLKTAAGTPIAGATVRFSLDGDSSTVVTNAAGIATTALTATTVGNRSLRLDYLGDGCHQGKVTSAAVDVLAQSATLTVITLVINDNGGAKGPGDFTIKVAGIAPLPAQFPGDKAGTTVTLNAGGYSVTEINTPGYNAVFSADCNGNIALGESRTCTVTNDDVPPTPPVANAQFAQTAEDTAAGITLTAIDVNGDVLQYQIVTAPSHGRLSGAAPSVTYTPDPEYYGPDGFTFRANDGALDSNVATVTIAVTPVNDAPVATDQSLVTDEDTAKAIALSATDIDGPALTYAIVSGPSHGSLLLVGSTATYTPASNYNGPDSFTFKATDGLLDSNIATVVVTVTPVNDPPTASAQAVTTAEDTATAITLVAADVDGPALTYQVVTGPAHGSFALVGSTVTYTPVANYYGADSLTFKASDGSLDSNVATVAITVTPVNDAPIAIADGAGTAARTPVIIVVLANDSDVDGDSLSVTAAGPASDGTVTLNAGGTLTYAPRGNFRGSDSFSYTVSDGHGGTTIGSVTVIVGIAANSAPKAVRDSVVTAVNAAVVIAVLLNDSDADGDALSVTAVSTPGRGVALISGNGTVTYTPAAGFSGQDRFTYSISDGKGGTAVGDVQVRVR